jgi:hypothetical protein
MLALINIAACVPWRWSRLATRAGIAVASWLLIQVAQVRLTARRYVLEDICKKLLHLLLIDRRESKPTLQQGLRARSL